MAAYFPRGILYPVERCSAGERVPHGNTRSMYSRRHHERAILCDVRVTLRVYASAPLRSAKNKNARGESRETWVKRERLLGVARPRVPVTVDRKVPWCLVQNASFHLNTSRVYVAPLMTLQSPEMINVSKTLGWREF